MPDESIIRETSQLLVAPLIFRCIAFRSRALHSQNWPDSLRKPILTDTPALGFAACCLRFDPDARKLAIIPLRSSGGESGNHVIALARRCQATSPDAPTNNRELRGSVGMQECFRDRIQHILCVTLPSFIPGAQGTPRPCAGSK